jgi:di/tripeptidase
MNAFAGVILVCAVAFLVAVIIETKAHVTTAQDRQLSMLDEVKSLLRNMSTHQRAGVLTPSARSDDKTHEHSSILDEMRALMKNLTNAVASTATPAVQESKVIL